MIARRGPWILPAVVGSLIAGVALAGFIVGNIIVSVDVLENIEIVGPTSFDVEMFPGETIQQGIILINHGSEDAPVELTSVIIPPHEGVNANDLIVTVPGDGEEHTYLIDIEAGTDTVPQLYTVTIAIVRE